MRVYYHPQMAAKTKSFSPSSIKPRLATESWSRLGLPIEIVSDFKAATKQEMCLAHSEQYIESLLACKIPNGFGNRSKAIARSLPWLAGALSAATCYSLKSGRPSFAPVSGSHHSGWDFSGCFTSMNHEIIAAQRAKSAGASRVGIIDCDAHHGNGTVQIVEKLSLDWIEHYSFGAASVRPGRSAKEWMARFPEIVFGFEGVDVIIYAASADSYLLDDLGSGSLTTAQLAMRDAIVFEVARELGIGVTVMLSGGYRRDREGGIRPVLDIHDTTFKIACEVYELGEYPRDVA